MFQHKNIRKLEKENRKKMQQKKREKIAHKRNSSARNKNYTHTENRKQKTENKKQNDIRVILIIYRFIENVHFDAFKRVLNKKKFIHLLKIWNTFLEAKRVEDWRNCIVRDFV